MQPHIVPAATLLAAEKAAENGIYILHSDINKNNDQAIALSNNDIKIKQYGSYVNETTFLRGHKNTITNVKFSHSNPSILLSSSLDGTINAWDLRDKNEIALTFSETSDDQHKPISSFDFNLEETILCGGTELVREDAFLIFWDLRTTNCLGGYWNSHTDAITQVRFNPSEDSVMATASVDGLINVFDLKEGCEDDALLSTLNVGSSVYRLCWGEDKLSCTTGIEDFQSWSSDEASPQISVSRDDLSRQSQLQIDYFIDTFAIGSSNYVATGTNSGTVYLWQARQNTLQPVVALADGHTDIVRTICHSPEQNYILTGGEDGTVSQWKLP